MPRSLLPFVFLLPSIASAQQNEFFESRIRPVLIERCYHCHNSAEDARGGVALDYRDGLRDGADEPLIVPGKPDESRLIAILRHEINGLEMPEDSGKLNEETIADFEKWIKDGAIDPRDKPPSAEDLAKATSWEAKLAKRKKWWSFQPIQDPEVPDLRRGRELPTPSRAIDSFIAAKLIENQLEPVPPAEPHIIIRRTYFALIGLPPSPDEVARWMKAITADRTIGMASMVDHLLASPHFGERWARHWMDWIRYAESHGSEGDPRIDNAFHYRDYLIRALNADVPYDQLVREHIAGDLLEEPRINDELGINESMIGPAHWRMVFHGFAPTDALDEKVRFTDDQINTFSKAFLGLTVSCARCHDHKFDAISQKDYYALFGILASTRPGRALIDVESKINKNREELSQLKDVVRQSVARHWATGIKNRAGNGSNEQHGLTARLLKDDQLRAKASEPDSIAYLWHRLKQQTENGISFDEALKPLLSEWRQDLSSRVDFQSRIHARIGRPTLHTAPLLEQIVQRGSYAYFNLQSESDYSHWFPQGTGLTKSPYASGAYAFSSTERGIYPAGVYSHILSAKHSARLTSPSFQLDGSYDLWVRAIGDNGATVRYVVENYPRNGTVFPVRNLSNEWKWHRFNLKYWEGDSVHVELTTGKDAPLLVKNTEHSWFGIRDMLLVKNGQPGPPQQDLEHLVPIFEAVISGKPGSFEDLADCYVIAIDKAIKAWSRGEASDSEALFLDHCWKQSFLPERYVGDSKANIDAYNRLEAEIIEPTRVPGLDETVGKNQRLMKRGDHRNLGDEVPRRFLEAIDPTPYRTKISGRRELAEDVLRDDNPLSRRVIVNRIWHHLFGHGIVRTPDNFGAMGDTPSHPELLDHLATRFVDQHNWSMKSLIRSIVLSRTWQLSSVPSAAATERDPDNRLLSHANVRRLEAEAIRDSMLAVSGLLQRRQFGPSVDGNAPRRSVYVQVIRNSLNPFLRAFDFPEPFSSKGRRDVTNVPAQSLMMMNDRQVTRFANAWVDRTFREAQSAPRAQSPLSPASDSPTSSTSDAGEKARVRGKKKNSQAPKTNDSAGTGTASENNTLSKPPHPNPLPRNNSLTSSKIALGGEGASARRIDFMFRTAFGRPATADDINRIQQYVAQSTAQLTAKRNELIKLKSTRDQLNARVANIIEPVRNRLLADAKAGKGVPEATLPKPVHRWDFETDARDVVGSAHAELRGGAKIEDGALVVQNGGYAVTTPLKRRLKAKTLEAWVQLDNLNQRAGGVITIQTPDGVTFDSIVFAERDARRWLSGSNNFARTQPFASAPAEDLAARQPVHLAISYHADGRIVGYRNGKPYGKGYKSNGPNEFTGNAIISFGVRHLPAGGNRLLSGRILTAQIYDRALNAAEIEATSKAASYFVSEETVLAELDEQQRKMVAESKSRITDLTMQTAAMGDVPDPSDQRVAWRNLAKAMFTFKEFIYLR